MEKLSKLSLLLLLFLISNNLQAQFTLEDADEPGILLSDSTVFLTHSYDIQLPSTTFDFRIKNTGEETIKVRIYLGDFDNADGNAELCLNGICVSFLVPNDYFPSLSEEPLIIQPGQYQEYANGCKFGTKSPGVIPELPLEYHLKFYQVDDNNNEIGTPINITYRYVPDITGVEDMKEDKINVYPNPASEIIYVSNQSENTISTYTIYAVDGSAVKAGTITSGLQSIDVKNLEKGMYFITLRSNDSNIVTKKIIIE